MIKEFLNWLLGTTDDCGDLTQAEYDEYEFLGEAMEWRRLSPAEQERFNELHAKRGTV